VNGHRWKHTEGWRCTLVSLLSAYAFAWDVACFLGWRCIMHNACACVWPLLVCAASCMCCCVRCCDFRVVWLCGVFYLSRLLSCPVLSFSVNWSNQHRCSSWWDLVSSCQLSVVRCHLSFRDVRCLRVCVCVCSCQSCLSIYLARCRRLSLPLWLWLQLLSCRVWVGWFGYDRT